MDIRELCGAKKEVDERIDKSIFQWFGHIGRKEDDRIAKRVFVRKGIRSCSVGRPRKRWID